MIFCVSCGSVKQQAYPPVNPVNLSDYKKKLLGKWRSLDLDWEYEFDGDNFIKTKGTFVGKHKYRLYIKDKTCYFEILTVSRLKNDVIKLSFKNGARQLLIISPGGKVKTFIKV